VPFGGPEFAGVGEAPATGVPPGEPEGVGVVPPATLPGIVGNEQLPDCKNTPPNIKHNCVAVIDEPPTLVVAHDEIRSNGAVALAVVIIVKPVITSGFICTVVLAGSNVTLKSKE
jgi:hypothetical protein